MEFTPIVEESMKYDVLPKPKVVKGKSNEK